jgi:hypothetical protein
MPSIPKGTTDVQFRPNFSNEPDYSDWVVEDRRKHFADWVDEECDEDYADCVVEERLEDYADCQRDEVCVEERKSVPKLRWSDLKCQEVVRLYDSLSFALWQYGPSAIMSAHIIILWRTLGITNHVEARHLLAQYLNRCPDGDCNAPCGSPATVTASLSAMSSRMKTAEARVFIVMF